MKQILRSFVLSVALSTAAAAGSLVETNLYGENFVTYAQVNRTDGTYRRMLTTPDVLATVSRGMPLPDGTRILMESYYSPGQIGTVFHKQKVDGRWEYGSFSGQSPVDLTTRPQASCLSCHAQAAETDFTFTRRLLDAAPKVGLSIITCDRGGRSPCDPAIYVEGVAN